MLTSALAPSDTGMGGRRMIKAAVVLIALGYCSLLVYHGGATFNFQESRPGASVQVAQLIDTVSKTTTEIITTNSSEEQNVKNITLDDIFISVKTTQLHQTSRLPIILKTWFQLAKNQTWFFTDINNTTHQQQTNGHMVDTNCPITHERNHLCCKTSVEYDHFMESGKKWFCHFDDDNYVNIPRLVEVLQRYNHREDWYLGRNSIRKPVNLFKKLTPTASVIYKFFFGTFGAGVCMSRSLAMKMTSLVSGGRFISICEKLRLPDDVSMGFIVEQVVKKNLTVVPEFHSHLEPMKLMPSENFRDQVTFSYSPNNTIDVPGFDSNYDPTRFLSLHCFLFPHFEFCPR